MKKENNKNLKLANSVLGGGIQNRNAFTLIELLAIIVILAIIAVITVPIILNVIENSKKGSIKDSAYGYKDAINKLYVSKLTEDASSDLTGVFTPEELKTKGLNVSGQEPIDGWVSMEKGTVLDYSLIFDEYVVNYDEETKEPIVTKGGELEASGIYYYGANAKEIYFNPVDGVYCTKEEYHIDNSLTGFNGIISGDASTKTTDNQNLCLKWYAYSEEAGNLNMILDHNTTAYTQWASNNDYTLAGGPNSISDSHIGPVTALNQLSNDTQNWNSILNRTDTYSVNIDSFNAESGTYDKVNYIIDYSGYKARLISAEEIAYITGANKPLDKGGYNWHLSITDEFSDGFSFGKTTWEDNTTMPIGTNKYAWLFNYTKGCTLYGCSIEDLYSNGYWTSTARSSNRRLISAVNEYGALNNRDDSIYYHAVTYPYSYGIRPVITVPKNI